MNALQPLLALLAQSESERDAAQTLCLRAQTVHDQTLAQADQLLGYRRDYEQRWGEQFAQQGRIELVRCYQGFVQRLSQAVDQQQQQVQRTAVQLAHAQQALRDHELRVASVRKLIEGRLREVQRETDRREQKQTDEFAARAAWNAMHAGLQPRVR
jgi:flagellar FliJ protein